MEILNGVIFIFILQLKIAISLMLMYILFEPYGDTWKINPFKSIYRYNTS
jgi:hypothetical protein